MQSYKSAIDHCVSSVTAAMAMCCCDRKLCVRDVTPAPTHFVDEGRQDMSPRQTSAYIENFFLVLDQVALDLASLLFDVSGERGHVWATILSNVLTSHGRIEVWLLKHARDGALCAKGSVQDLSSLKRVLTGDSLIGVAKTLQTYVMCVGFGGLGQSSYFSNPPPPFVFSHVYSG